MSMIAERYNDILKNHFSTDNIWESCIYDMLNSKHNIPRKDFVESSLLSLNKHLNADYVCVESFSDRKEVMDVVCVCNRTKILSPSSFHNIGTPREQILTDHIITVKENVRDVYPNNPLLSELKIEAYSSIVLFDSVDMPIGVLTALYSDKIMDDKKVEALMYIYSHTLSRNLECARERKLQEAKNVELLIYKEELERTNKKLNKLNKELKIANHKAKEGQQLKSSFLSNLSHEIRTPMNAILGFAELLKSNSLGEEERNKYLDIVLQNGGLLLRVMDDLIDISKLQTKQRLEGKGRVSVNELIVDLENNYKRKIIAMQKPIKLILLLGNPDGKDILVTHKEALYKTLDHLINNAVKFTKRGHVFIGYTAENGVFEFFVKDSGIGIPLGKEKSIFGLFRQINVTLSREFDGNGIGLSIAKKYVEIMGGEIWADPTQREGALFKFSIPVG